MPGADSKAQKNRGMQTPGSLADPTRQSSGMTTALLSGLKIAKAEMSPAEIHQAAAVIQNVRTRRKATAKKASCV